MLKARPIRKQYSHAIADDSKLKRRLQAEQRQAIRDKRTTAMQLTLIKTRRGNSAKETERLLKCQKTSIEVS